MRRSGLPFKGGSAATWRERGSAVLFVLFAIVVVALSIQTLTVVVMCGQRSLTDEASGRSRLANTDGSLVALKNEASKAWGGTSWTRLDSSAPCMYGCLGAPEDADDWLLQATVGERATPAGGSTSVMIERGRDGLDLPFAALVATCVSAADGRTVPWLAAAQPALVADDSTDGSVEAGMTPAESTVAYSRRTEGPVVLDTGCSLQRLDSPWALDDGWRFELGDHEVKGPSVVVLAGPEGQVVKAPASVRASSQEHPVLVIVVGGADCDLRSEGVVWGVVVADRGSVLLEGTTLHGAVFAGDTVALGVGGQVVFSGPVLRWACDRSLVRVRLVPGTREESTG